MTAIRVTWTIVAVSVMTAMAVTAMVAVTCEAVRLAVSQVAVNYYLVAQIKSQKEPGILLYR